MKTDTTTQATSVRKDTRFFRGRSAGFTMMELLAVIAIIGVLAAILIPTVGKVRQTANDGRSRAQFSQWITAMESFKQEYGYYPDLKIDRASGEPSGEADYRLTNEAQRATFIEVLTGRKVDGDRFDDNPFYQNHPNRRQISFYSFSENELEYSSESDVPYVVDAYGNNDILFVVDITGDGIIDSDDLQGANELPVVSPRENPSGFAARPNLPDRGIRAGVIIYSAGKPASTEVEAGQNLVKSWE